MAMPRFTSGTVPSATALNALASEIDNLGVVCKVRRTSALSIPTATDITIPWQQRTFDTRGDMWSVSFPTQVNVRISGSYILVMQQRFSPNYLGTVPGAGNGRRACKIMVNGTSVFSNSVCSDIRNASADAEGVTLVTIAFARLFNGDYVAANTWHSAGQTILGLHGDYGGSSMTVARVAPLAV